MLPADSIFYELCRLFISHQQTNFSEQNKIQIAWTGKQTLSVYILLFRTEEKKLYPCIKIYFYEQECKFIMMFLAAFYRGKIFHIKHISSRTCSWNLTPDIWFCTTLSLKNSLNLKLCEWKFQVRKLNGGNP